MLLRDYDRRRQAACKRSAVLDPAYQHPGKMFVTQPRRIAARSLCQRVRQISQEPHLVGLRLGHGERDEHPETRVWFATVGYVALLLAHHAEHFKYHTHLIIDEVHERSIDTDILCLLARRLLATHPTIKLVLMSATIAAELHRQYFGVPEPPLFVGARRFPITEYFADDLCAGGAGALVGKLASSAADIVAKTARGEPRSPHIARLQAEIAVQLTRQIADRTQRMLPLGGHGGGTGGGGGHVVAARSSVLIFVAGMAEIMDLVERFSKLQGTQPGAVRYQTVAIHSEVPEEEQLQAFDVSADATVIKVVIATNAAESSITLPDVDYVIDLGVSKQIEYNAARHRVMLSPLWISRASVTQRSGRTGRVRPGTVFHLYARELHARAMRDFDEGEIRRQPLDAVILQLRGTLGGRVEPVLRELLEPPDLSTIDRSFDSLHEAALYSLPSDDGALTSLGEFVSQLGLDLLVGRVVGLGSMFGCLPEVVALAATLSLPKSPFRLASQLVQRDPCEYSAIVCDVMRAKGFWDAGVGSEPLMLVNVLFAYRVACQVGKQHEFCTKYALAHVRMRHLNSIYNHLRQRVAQVLHRAEATSLAQMGAGAGGGGGGRAAGRPRTYAGYKLEPGLAAALDAQLLMEVNAGPEASHPVAPAYLFDSWGPAKLNILRLILVWVFRDQLVEGKLEASPAVTLVTPPPPAPKSTATKVVSAVTVTFRSGEGRLHEWQLEGILPVRHRRALNYQFNPNLRCNMRAAGTAQQVGERLRHGTS